MGFTMPFADDVMEASSIEELKDIAEEMPDCERCGKPAHHKYRDGSTYCSSWCHYLHD